MPLIRGAACAFNGNEFKVNAQMNVPDAVLPVPVIIAALGPKMLKIAGEKADGTTTWMTGPNTLESHTIPKIRAAAKAADKKEPRIVASFPIVLTENAPAAIEVLNTKIAIYGHIPSYQKMLEIEGTDNPTDLAMVGNEQQLRSQIKRLKDIGVTDFNAFCITVDDNSNQRTMEFLASEKNGLFN